MPDTEPACCAQARADLMARIAADAEKCDAIWPDPVTREERPYSWRVEHLEDFES